MAEHCINFVNYLDFIICIKTINLDTCKHLNLKIVHVSNCSIQFMNLNKLFIKLLKIIIYCSKYSNSVKTIIY